MSQHHDIIKGALDKQEASRVDCPIMINPRCHPQARWMVHVNGKKRLVYLSCAVCDRLMTVIKARKQRDTK